jgi:membrane protein YdbS with pleckstrin-like domain
MKTFEASRLTEGNKVFPTKVIITNRSVTIKKPGVFSSDEKIIPMSQITHVDVSCPFVGFSSITFGTENEPVKVSGFTKSEVNQIKDIIFSFI